jgi:chromosome segregation ATPase
MLKRPYADIPTHCESHPPSFTGRLASRWWQVELLWWLIRPSIDLKDVTSEGMEEDLQGEVQERRAMTIPSSYRRSDQEPRDDTQTAQQMNDEEQHHHHPHHHPDDHGEPDSTGTEGQTGDQRQGGDQEGSEGSGKEEQASHRYEQNQGPDEPGQAQGSADTGKGHLEKLKEELEDIDENIVDAQETAALAQGNVTVLTDRQKNLGGTLDKILQTLNSIDTEREAAADEHDTGEQTLSRVVDEAGDEQNPQWIAKVDEIITAVDKAIDNAATARSDRLKERDDAKDASAVADKAAADAKTEFDTAMTAFTALPGQIKTAASDVSKFSGEVNTLLDSGNVKDAYVRGVDLWIRLRRLKNWRDPQTADDLLKTLLDRWDDWQKKAVVKATKFAAIGPAETALAYAIKDHDDLVKRRNETIKQQVNAIDLEGAARPGGAS